MLNISIDKVAYVALMARQDEEGYEEGGSFNDKEFDLDAQHDLSDFEDNQEKPSNPELAEYIDDLNDDEALDLVVIMWVGRGTFSVDQLDEAREIAEEEATHSTSDYLLGTPMLADYLEAGLSEFGYSTEDIEKAAL